MLVLNVKLSKKILSISNKVRKNFYCPRTLDHRFLRKGRKKKKWDAAFHIPNNILTFQVYK